jgi:hypothetical protein
MGSANRPLTNGQSLQVISAPSATTYNETTFTVPSGYPHIVFYVRNNAGSTLTIDDVVNAFQVELGSIATAYEPYVQPQTASVPMLLSVGDYADEGEIISGIKTGRVGIFVSDGTANWVTTSTPNGFALSIPGKLQSRTAVVKSTHYAYNVSTLPNIPDGCVMSYGTTAIGIKDSRFTTVEALNAEHAAHPVIFVYPLATETTEQTTPQHLVTHKGTNVVEVTANVSPVSLEVVYAKEG